MAKIKTKSLDRNVLLAGFGGQGIITAGNVLAYACLEAGLNLLATASYGAEMRGGTARAMILISDEEIDSPIIEQSNLAIIMNAPSTVEYLDTIQSGSPVFLNSSMIDDELVTRSDLDIVMVDATNLAIGMGNIRVANIIMLGAVIQKTGIISEAYILKGLKRAFSKSKRGLYYINESAFKLGLNLELEC